MTDIKPNVPKIIIPSNPSNDMEEDNSTSSSLSEMKETEYPHSSSSSLSISFEDKKDANNNIGKTTPREKKKEALPEQQDNEKKKEKRSKRGSFKRIREEGEGLVKSFSGIFSGKEKTKKQESNDSVPPSPRTKYHKSSSSSSSSEARQKRRNNNVSSSSSDTNNNYPQSDDDNLRTRAKKTRNRLSIVNLSDLIKSSDDKKEKENRRRTFHFTTGQFDNIDFSDPKNSFVNNNNNNNNEANTVKNKRGILISTIKYDSPISGKFIANSAPVSPTTFGKEDDNDNNNNNLISSIQKLAIEEEEEDEKQIEIDLPETKERELNETTTATSQTTAITSSTTTTTTTTTAVSLNEKNEGIKEDCAANNNNNDDDDGDDDVEQKFGRDISNDTEIFDGIGSDRTRNITTTTTIANNNASNILLEPSSLNSILSNNVAKTSSSSTNNSHTLGDIKGSEESKTIYKVPKFSTNINKVGVNIDDDKNEEDLTIVMTGEASNNNKIGNFATKNENKVEDNPNKISMLESIVLRQLDLAEKMQETMSRLESKVSGQMEDTIRKLEDKINEQNVELDDLKTIVGKLQENQQMMIANEAYHNQDLQAIHRELALVSQTSSTSFSHLQQQVYTRNTLVDTLVVRPLYNTITVSASIATSVMYTVYVRPVVSLVRVVRQGL